MKKQRKTLWIIWVAGYGAFEFVGTEDQAEEMRRHKARWEAGIAFKWNTNLTTGEI